MGINFFIQNLILLFIDSLLCEIFLALQNYWKFSRNTFLLNKTIFEQTRPYFPKHNQLQQKRIYYSSMNFIKISIANIKII